MDLQTIARGGFPVTLGKPRILFFDMTATKLLVERYGGRFLQALYTVTDADKMTVELKDLDALVFFLWAGVQSDARANGEEVTPEQIAGYITPLAVEFLFMRVVRALWRVLETPAQPGKQPAAAASPAGAVAAQGHPGPTKTSAMMKRSGSPSRSSAGGRSGSGRVPSASSTSRGKGTSTR